MPDRYPLGASTSNAITSPREDLPTASQVPTPIRSRVMLGMGGNVRPLAKVVGSGSMFSDVANLRTWKPRTPEQAEALRVLRGQQEPLRPAKITASTGLPLHRVKRWLRLLADESILVATRRGHVWAEGARP